VDRIALTASYWSAATDEDILPTTIGGVLAAAADDAPQAGALVEVRADGAIGRRWTYRALLEDSRKLATALAARFRQGERIAVWAPNMPEWALLEFAAAMAGLTLVTVNPAYQAKELDYVLRQSRSVGLFLIREHRGNPMAAIAAEVCGSLPAIRAVIDMEDAQALFDGADPSRPLPPVAPGDPAQIQYTSGTTGFPKGAVLSHHSLTNNARFSVARMGGRAGDSYLNVMPMFHTSGCSVGLLGSVQWRCRMLMMRQFDPHAVNAVIESERVNLMIAVPTMLIGMLEAQERHARTMTSLRTVMSGGAMVPPELVRRTKEAFGCPLTIIYGQTETSPGLTQTDAADSLEDRCETVGRPFPQTELSIRDTVTNAVLPVGAVGEICARGYCNMIGYNDNPKATAETIDADGWLHTGDLGTMDARGYLRVTGRVKEMIIRGGENIFPAEIENVLAEHAAIAEVAVVGVPDEKWGEIAICFFRPQPGAIPSRAELVAHVRRDLAAPKTPAVWVAVEDFPMTGSGKVQKFVLRQRYLAGDFAQRILS
jgi:fatty-acyl-CoA synthase